MSLLKQGEFTLHSGEKSFFKIDCDFLTDEDIETLAFMVSKKIKFSGVSGVPTGGNRLKKALEKYRVSSEECETCRGVRARQCHAGGQRAASHSEITARPRLPIP